MNPYELCDVPLFFYSLFHDEILSLARAPFESLLQSFGTHPLPIFVILNLSLLPSASQNTVFSVSLPQHLTTNTSPSALLFYRDYGAL